MLINLQKYIIKKFSINPEQGRYSSNSDDISQALNQLNKMFPDFSQNIINKRILDFGCGQGYQTMALSMAGAGHVVGVDIDIENLNNTQKIAQKRGLHNVTYCKNIDVNTLDRFDIIISHNSMEHFQDPFGILQFFSNIIEEKGKVYITFGPPWFSPYGAHMNFFTKIPWVHLLFSEKAVMAVRADFTDDGATCYENVRGGLNKMSLNKFEKLLFATDLQVSYQSYIYMFNWNWLRKIPILRELCLYHINVILEPQKTS